MRSVCISFWVRDCWMQTRTTFIKNVWPLKHWSWDPATVLVTLWCVGITEYTWEHCYIHYLPSYIYPVFSLDNRRHVNVLLFSMRSKNFLQNNSVSLKGSRPTFLTIRRLRRLLHEMISLKDHPIWFHFDPYIDLVTENAGLRGYSRTDKE